jgi:hypothetical protein
MGEVAGDKAFPGSTNKNGIKQAEDEAMGNQESNEMYLLYICIISIVLII